MITAFVSLGFQKKYCLFCIYECNLIKRRWIQIPGRWRLASYLLGHRLFVPNVARSFQGSILLQWRLQVETHFGIGSIESLCNIGAALTCSSMRNCGFLPLIRDKYKIASVIHLAALKSVADSNNNSNKLLFISFLDFLL